MREAWGKFDSGTGAYHPLAHHSMDVAAVFARILALPVVRDRVAAAANRVLEETDCQRLAALVFLHDIGKLHPGFQAKGWPSELWNRPTCGHQREGCAFLEVASRDRSQPFHECMRQILKWGEAVEAIIAAAFSHHGRPVEWPSDPTQGDWPRLPHYDWRQEATAIAGAVRDWFPRAFNEGSLLPNEPRFHHLVAGFAALADWIGSNTAFFPFQQPFDSGYDAVAHDRAGEALTTIGLETGALGDVRPATFRKLTDGLSPNAAQRAVADVDVDARLVILEAETGSGKTEAALWRYTKLFGAGKVSGLYFAVPTRAAARQLHGRVHQAIQQAYGRLAPEAVLAIPGLLRSGDFEGRRLPNWNVLWDDQQAASHRRQTPESALHRWAAEHATRFLAAPIAVGTVDQAMLSALQVKHAHMRGSALSRSLLVVDEVHASDSYMTRILQRLTDEHLAIGGHAMLMSATLGATARVGWTRDALPSPKEATALPYPAVWVAGNPEPRSAPAAGRPRRVRVSAVETMAPPRAAAIAVDAARRGARVLVIRNTVTTAIETWEAVQETGGASLLMQAGGGPALHHSRFAVEDREVLDGAVEEALGKDREPSAPGCIVVGTQTLEQSLDIDADMLITDLCPIDVLLQRIGRLHRHPLARPDGFEQATAFVLLPEGGLDRLAAPAFHNGLGAWEGDTGFTGVYRDLAGLELTQRLINAHSEWRIPEMNRELVEGGTHPELIASLLATKDERWQRYHQKLSGADAAAAGVAALGILDREMPFDADLRFPNSDEHVLTRLGEEGLVLGLESRPVSPFGVPISRLALPARWSKGISPDDNVAVAPEAQGLEMTVAAERFSYTRRGLTKC